MPTFDNRVLVLLATTLFATSACGGNTTVPNAAVGSNSGPQVSAFRAAAPGAGPLVPNDSTSILKKLKKDVVIGSTVDPNNGDMGPRALSVVRSSFGLTKGQLLVCNFENSAGVAGKGSTIEVLNPKPHSQPKTFTQNTKIQGCNGDAITEANQVYATGMQSHSVSQFDQTGALQNTYNSHLAVPFDDADAYCGFPYAPEDIYVSDSKLGTLVKLAFVAVSGGHTSTEVIKGFGINKGSGWSILGPSGMQYDSHRTGSLCNDTLYVVDGVDNTVIAVSNASNLLQKDEIVVQPGGKKFKCLHPEATCATLVHSGSPLNAPVAAALLPNENLIVANTKGGNKLVELTPAGKVLATKTIDTSATAHIFGLLATGTSDSDTVLFYTDTQTNTLHELTR
ncbi:MAG TPA: hypothetical protein VGF86_05425 [Candidatus Tumulicola sp.]|jgi:hypothetical protein